MAAEDPTGLSVPQQEYSEKKQPILSSQEIQKSLPHRFPFLLVDRIIEENVSDRRMVGIKAVSGNEPFFQGHFPNYPIMPGVLIVEALGQVCALSLCRHPNYKDHLAFLVGLENFRFRRQVIPGDVLRLEVTLTALHDGFGRARSRALVDDEVAAEGDILFAIGPVLPG